MKRTKILDSNTLNFQPRMPSPSSETFLISKWITKKRPSVDIAVAMQTPVILLLSRQMSNPRKPVSSWLKFSHAQRQLLYAIFLQLTAAPHITPVMTKIRFKHSRMIVFPQEAHRYPARTQITVLFMDILIQRHFQKFKIRT